MRWFHKEDGGLMIARDYYMPLYNESSTGPIQYIEANFGHVCAMCDYLVYNPSTDPSCARFSDLPEDLQATALGEML